MPSSSSMPGASDAGAVSSTVVLAVWIVCAIEAPIVAVHMRILVIVILAIVVHAVLFTISSLALSLVRDSSGDIRGLLVASVHVVVSRGSTNHSDKNEGQRNLHGNEVHSF